MGTGLCAGDSFLVPFPRQHLGLGKPASLIVVRHDNVSVGGGLTGSSVYGIS